VRPLRTFQCHDLKTGERKVVHAHYLTTEQHVMYNGNQTKFWVKRRWFQIQIDECVAILIGDWWQVSSGESDHDIARQLGVKL
jgi:hypothetical protein